MECRRVNGPKVLIVLRLAAFFGALVALPAFAGNISYTYDELGRLKSASYGNGVYTNYGLDAAGNRTVVTSGTDTVAPSVPTSPVATANSSNQVTVTWLASTDSGGSGLVGYQIFRGGTQIGSSTGLTFIDASTLGTTTYAYTVKAYDAAGNVSAASTVANVTTPDTIAPSVPAGLAVTTATSTAVSLSWGASTDTGGSGLAGYHIYRNGVQIGTTSGLTYTDSSVTGWVTYAYTVSAYDNAGNVSVPSGALSIKVPDTIPPSVPSGVVATAANANEVDITWPAATDTGSGIAGYRVYRSGTLISTTPAGPGYVDYAVAGGTALSYTIAAIDNAGNVSAQSTAASVTTPPGVPPAPIISISAATIVYPGTYSVSWSAIAGTSSYKLYQSINLGTFSLNYSGTALMQTFSNKLANEYDYYVQSCNASGCSVASQTVTVTVCPSSGCP